MKTVPELWLKGMMRDQYTFRSKKLDQMDIDSAEMHTSLRKEGMVDHMCYYKEKHTLPKPGHQCSYQKAMMWLALP